MNEMEKNENGFVGYEYKDTTVKREMEAVYADGYTNFGWTLDGTTSSPIGVGSVTMKFKRDRKIRNKAELSRLQRQFDSSVAEIEKLEFSKISTAAATAYAIGLIGTVFMAGSVFAFTGGLTILSIILAVPAFAGWIIPYWCYRKISGRKTGEINPMIDQKYDEIYDISEKANALLALA